MFFSSKKCHEDLRRKSFHFFFFGGGRGGERSASRQLETTHVFFKENPKDAVSDFQMEQNEMEEQVEQAGRALKGK